MVCTREFHEQGPWRRKLFTAMCDILEDGACPVCLGPDGIAGHTRDCPIDATLRALELSWGDDEDDAEN